MKILPAKQETQAQSQGPEDLLTKEMTTHPSILPGKSHVQSSLASYSPWGCKRVGHNLATQQQQQQRTT